MTWRLFIIQSRNPRAVYFPVVLLAISGIIWIIVLVNDIFLTSQLRDPASFFHYHTLVSTAMLVDITLTWYLTSFICYRLWGMEKENRSLAVAGGLHNAGNAIASPYTRVIKALMQSGILFSVTFLTVVGCLLGKSIYAMEIVSLFDTRIVGITSVLILLPLEAGTPERTRPSTAFSTPVFCVPKTDDTSQVQPRRDSTPQNGRPLGTPLLGPVAVGGLTSSATSSKRFVDIADDGVV
ncbi:hypothetical protein FRB93_001476 [Tulasnella sp. JGI-2019a]|nr:hypothetical protein FRB93_001476 [Tulasnella sp. JGI-2019a]